MRIILSNSSGDPIYQQISSQVKKQIISGDLEAGEALPSIRSLAKELQVSVITTKNAYEVLEKEGFINTVAGRGTFVASQNRELLKEKKLKIVEEKLAEAVEQANLLGISTEEIIEMIRILTMEE